MNPTPAFSIASVMRSPVTSTLTPRAVKTSEAPEIDETDRLPCLATLAPAPAATSDAHVETL